MGGCPLEHDPLSPFSQGPFPVIVRDCRIPANLMSDLKRVKFGWNSEITGRRAPVGAACVTSGPDFLTLELGAGSE
jgi:hypothetical protein